MSPLTTVGLVLGALAVMMLEVETRKRSRPSQWFALALALMPVHVLLCYAYGNLDGLAVNPGWSYMALPLAALAAAVLLHDPGCGITHASRVFRQLLLALLFLPPADGWIVLDVLRGERNPPEFGVGTTVLLCVVILAALAWANAASLNRAEEAIRESEERYRATFDKAAIAIAHVGVDGRWLHFNDTICDISGYPRHELMTMTVMDISHTTTSNPTGRKRAACSRVKLTLTLWKNAISTKTV